MAARHAAGNAMFADKQQLRSRENQARAAPKTAGHKVNGRLPSLAALTPLAATWETETKG